MAVDDGRPLVHELSQLGLEVLPVRRELLFEMVRLSVKFRDFATHLDPSLEVVRGKSVEFGSEVGDVSEEFIECRHVASIVAKPLTRSLVVKRQGTKPST